MNLDTTRKLAREAGLEYLESAIRPGALATSDTLNRFRQTLESSVEELSEDVQRYGEDTNRVQDWIAAMTQWLASFVASANIQLQSLGGNTRSADLFVSTGWTFSDPSMQDKLFGQIMPPVTMDAPSINTKKVIYITPSPVSPTPRSGGDFEVDIQVALDDPDWLYPVVLPDSNQQYLWIYCPLKPSYNPCNNISVSFIPWGGARIESIWVESNATWRSVYSDNGNSNIAAGRFWWDVRSVGHPTAVGMVVELLHSPIAVAHFLPRATSFGEHGVAVFNAPTLFGSSASISSYQIHTAFPQVGGQVATEIIGVGSNQLQITVKRISAQVPTVIDAVLITSS